MKFLISAFTLGIFFAHPVAAVTIADRMTDHDWTTRAHGEDVTGSTGGSKDHSRAR